ncbi:MAG: hypothetical protein EOM23_07030, partial [Candidatus Moranbacteria bacterium]|nr:hypothetical protein [Candidatus Moranbacteria bacterium]
MKNYSIIILTTTIILGLTTFLFASTPEASQRPRGGGSGIVMGKVIDSTTSEPVEFANILFFSQADSTLVTGGITGQGGIFAIEQVPFGRYYT